jgi:hypothetical protein
MEFSGYFKTSDGPDGWGLSNWYGLLDNFPRQHAGYSSRYCEFCVWKSRLQERKADVPSLFFILFAS